MEPHFSQRISSIDEKLSSWLEDLGETVVSHLLEARVSSVQRSDANRKRKVEQLFTGLELEVLNCNTPVREAPGIDLGSGTGDCLSYSPGRPIDGEHMPVTDPLDHGPGRCAGPATDLQDAKTGA